MAQPTPVPPATIAPAAVSPATILRDLLIKLKRAAPHEIAELMHYATGIVDALPLACSLSEKTEFGLFDGFLNTLESTSFFKRFKVESEQKISLATYCMDNCGMANALRDYQQWATGPKLEPILQNRPWCFLECGSTIAYLIGQFARELRGARDKRYGELLPTLAELTEAEPFSQARFLTNSFVALTALAGHVDHIEPTAGRLSSKYLGFLIASEDPPTDQIDWRREGIRYQILADDVEICNSVFATCSSFSFLLGPLVGSRANCITKAAIYSGVQAWTEYLKRNKRFFLLFHYNKLVPLEPTDRSMFIGTTEHCKNVFPLPGTNVTDQMDDILDSNGGGLNGADGLYRSFSLSPKELSVPVNTLLEKCRPEADNWQFLDRSWLEWLNVAGRFRKVEIVISLPTDGDLGAPINELQQELERTNSILKGLSYNYNFRMKDTEEVARNASVACVHCTG